MSNHGNGTLSPSVSRGRGRVKICHVVNRLEIGGMENGVVNLLNHHDREAFEPMLCCLNGTGAMVSRISPDVGVFDVGLPEGQKQLVYGPFKAAGIFRRERPTVVHTHGWGGGSFVGILGARLAGVPVIVNGEHGSFFTRRYQVALQRMLASLCDQTLSVSRSLKDQTVLNLGIKPSRIKVIENGVDTDAFGAEYPDGENGREGLGIVPRRKGSTAFVIGSVGTLRPEKNQRALIRVVKEIEERRSIPGLMVFFIGDGPDRPELVRLVSELGLDHRVSFLGHRSDVAALLSKIDLLVSTSVPYWEGLSNVMLEAMSSRVPVIFTRSVGSSEVIRDGFNGFVVDHDDADDLRAKIELLARDASLFEEMGRHAREFVCENYSIRSMVAAYERTYLDLLGRRGGI